MYSKRAFARVGLAAYFDISRRARLMNGPSGVDSIDALCSHNTTASSKSKSVFATYCQKNKTFSSLSRR